MDAQHFCSSQIEISENKHYLELENLVCYYDYPNANHRQLDYGSTPETQAHAEAMAQTLVNMPVRAKYTVNAQGQPTFRGHEAREMPDGTIELRTEKIGTHTAAWIEERDVTTFDGRQMRLPCLVAKQIVWKDNRNVVAAIKRLFSLGKLNTSWEIDVSEYHYVDGVKHLEDYAFIGNALLGYEYADPAYGEDAKVTALASVQPEENYELMIAEALSQDLVEKEVKQMAEVVVNTPEVEEKEAVGAEQPEIAEPQAAEEAAPAQEASEKEPETAQEQEPAEGATPEGEASQEEKASQASQEASAMTANDIRWELDYALSNAIGEGHIVYWFPEDHRVWFHLYGAKETSFFDAGYEVTGDKVTILSLEPFELSVGMGEVPMALTNLAEENQRLRQEVSELQTYKEQVEAERAEAAEARRKQEVAQLRELARQAGCFTEEEMASSEMAELFENLRTTEVKAMIFDKKMAEQTAHEMSEADRELPVQRTLTLDYEVPTIDRAKRMSELLGEKKG